MHCVPFQPGLHDSQLPVTGEHVAFGLQWPQLERQRVHGLSGGRLGAIPSNLSTSHCPLRPRDTGEHPGPRWISQAEAASVLYVGKVRWIISEGSQASASLLRPLLCDSSFPGFTRDARGYPPSPSSQVTTPPLPPSHPSLFLPSLCPVSHTTQSLRLGQRGWGQGHMPHEELLRRL